MPIDFEDTDANISGDPEPVRPMTKLEQNAAVHREVGRAGPSQPKPNGKEPERQQGQGHGEEQQDQGASEEQHPGMHPQIQQALQPHQDSVLSGPSWFDKIGDDPEMAYYAAQELGNLIAAAFRVGGPDYSPTSHAARVNGKARGNGAQK